MRAQSIPILWLAAVTLALISPRGFGEGPGWVQPNLTQARAASFARPYLLEVREVETPKPLWAEGRLFVQTPRSLRGLAKVSYAGFPTFDPGTEAWYASADGSLVRVDADGRLPVMVDDVQGLDVDVRAAPGLAVSREPNDQIVLHAWRGGEGQKKVLLTGGYFFNPRFSPDASRVLVAESRAGGGHLWLVETSSGKAQDLGQGYDAAWHPDGRRIIFVRIEHDGSEVTASTIFLLDLATRRETKLMRTEGARSALAPAIAPDGKLLAYASAGGRAVLLVPLDSATGQEARR